MDSAGSLLTDLWDASTQSPREFAEEFRHDARRHREAIARLRRELGPRYWPLFLARQDGNPVILEHLHGQRLSHDQMTFPPHGSTRRNYYRVNDVVLTGNFTQQELEGLYPELTEDSGDSERDVLIDLALAYLGESPPKYPVGHRITNIQITDEETGDGSVELTPVIFFAGSPNAPEADNVEVVELSPRSRSRLILIGDFQQQKYGPMPELIPVLEAVAEMTQTVLATSLTAGGNAAVNQIARRSVRRIALRQARAGARRSIRRILVGFARGRFPEACVDGVRAFTQAFATEILGTERQQQLREAAGARPLMVDDITPAITKAVLAFAVAFLTKLFGGSLDDAIARSSRELFRGGGEIEQYLTRGLKERMATWITQQVSHFILRDPASRMLAAITKSLRDSQRLNEPFSDHFNRNISSVIPGTTDFRNAVQGLLGAVVDPDSAH